MTLVGKREEFARAIDTVADMSGHAFRPFTPDVGDAWPILGPGERAAGTAFELTWAVRVFVPQDEETASQWWDAHWPRLFEALSTVAFVDRFEPVVSPAAGGEQLMFQVSTRAEE